MLKQRRLTLVARLRHVVGAGLVTTALIASGLAAAPAAAVVDPNTTTYIDSGGSEVFRVDSGYDLDRYLYAPSSPLDFGISVERSFGPVDSAGHPAPGNVLYGQEGRITIRVYDVDDDYAGGTYVRELDQLRVNGVTLPGYLSGADSQWSINSFRFPLNLLKLPTLDNPGGLNSFQVLIDTGNGGQSVWAVTVDWAELRLVNSELPVAMVHGITGNNKDDPDTSSMSTFKTYFEDEHPVLDGRAISPSMTKNGSMRENVTILEGKFNELLARTGEYQMNIVAHSMGGLASRLYAFDHPSQIRNLLMVATPNGGSRMADVLCGNRNIPFLLRGLANEALDYFTRNFGECNGPDDGLYQLQESYVQDVFNKQVPDRHGTRYSTIAGQGFSFGNALLDGEDDGAVSVSSVRYLRPDSASDPNPDHAGRHTVLLPTYEKDHSGLIQSGSPAMPRALCYVYPKAARCAGSSGGGGGGGGGGAFSAASAEASTAATSTASLGMQELVAAAGPVVPARGAVDVPVTFEGASAATVLVLSEPGVTASLGGATFAAGDVFGVPGVAASLVSPSDGALRLTNTGASDVPAVVLVAIATGRRMTVTSPTLVAGGTPIAISATLTEAEPGDAPRAVIADATGATVADSPLVSDGAGGWNTTVPALAAGAYSVRAFVEGARPRWATDVFSVSSGAAKLTGAFSEQLTGMADGLADALVIRPGITVATPGAYRVAARLVDSAGAQVSTAGGRATLAAGAQSIPLSFTGRDIFAAGRSGQFRVVDVVLSRDDANLSLEDRRANLGLTRSYDYRSFDHDRVEIDPTAFTDAGVDADGNNEFEALRVTGAVRVDTAGSYAINARLVTVAGTELGEYQAAPYLAAGTNAFTLTFPGRPIGESGIDGPYIVEDLSIYPTSSANALGYMVTAHTTAPYSSDDFVGGAVTYPRLRAILDSQRNSGGVADGAYRSLRAKLDASEAAFDRGNNTAARNQLAAFRRELSAQRGNHVSEDAYAKLDAAAARLLAKLG